MYLIEESDPVISNCHFHSNSTQGSGGAININEGSDPHVHHSFFTSNNSGAGGAIYIRAEGTSPLIEWCEFNQNSANIEARVGGALYIRGQAEPEIRYNRISQNNADFGGGFYVKEHPHCSIHHNLFLKNGATTGGGAFGTSNDLGETPLVLTSNTFFGNLETGLDVVANLGFIREGANVVINSSIIWGEVPHFSGGGGIEVRYSNLKYEYEGEENRQDLSLIHI